jgi:dolichol-phosphate mannosyltransferase
VVCGEQGIRDSRQLKFKEESPQGGSRMSVELQIVMPVHNEAGVIGTTLKEWHEALSPRVNVQFILTEDGSKDGTQEVLTKLAARYPMLLDMCEKRRGYTGAMIAGMKLSTAPYVLAVDADGQFDPQDFEKFWQKREGCPVQIGWRLARADVLARKIMSKSFKALHRLLFRVKLHDASCGYVLMQRAAMEKLLPDLGLVPEGFWLEVTARASRRGISVQEVPIHHRSRTAGTTVVYKPWRVPGIAWRNATGLVRVWASRA